MIEKGNVEDIKEMEGVFNKQILRGINKIVKLLLANKTLQRNAINNDGLTAMDCLLNSDGDSENYNELRVTLKREKIMKATDVQKHEHEHVIWLDKQSNVLMVVAVLIATMAFQYGVSPNWEIKDYYAHGISKIDMQANFDELMIWNTISFVSSLSVVLMLVSGLPHTRFFVVILMLTIWLSITTILWTYFLALGNPLSTELGPDVYKTIQVALFVWMALIFFLLFRHAIRFLIKWVKKLVHLAKPSWNKCVRPLWYKCVRPLWYKYVLRRQLPVIAATSFNSVQLPPLPESV